MTEEEAAIHIQGLWKTRAARKMVQAMVGEVFEKAYDEKVGACYYYNKLTQQAQWEKPKLLGSTDLVETPRSAAVEKAKHDEIEAKKAEVDMLDKRKREQDQEEYDRRKRERLEKIRREGLSDRQAALLIQVWYGVRAYMICVFEREREMLLRTLARSTRSFD
jgi:hypothetical protein